MKQYIVIGVLVLAALSAAAGWLHERDTRIASDAAHLARIEKDSAALVVLYESRAEESARADAAEARAMASQVMVDDATANYDKARADLARMDSLNAVLLAGGRGSQPASVPAVPLPMVQVPGDFVASADRLRASCGLLRVDCAREREARTVERMKDAAIIANLTSQLGESKAVSGPAPGARSGPRRVKDISIGGAIGLILGALAGWQAAKATPGG